DSLQELVAAFSLEHVSKEGSKFDPEKTKWFQDQYFQDESNEKLAAELQALLKAKNVGFNKEYLKKIVSLLKERASFVTDFWELGHYFFVGPENYEEKASKKAWKEDSAEIMEQVIEQLEEVSDFNSKDLQEKVKGWITSRNIGFGKVMQPFRLSLVGSMQGPDVFEIASTLGKEESMNRLRKAVEVLG